MIAVYCEMRDVLTGKTRTTKALEIHSDHQFWCDYTARTNRIYDRLTPFAPHRPHYYVAPYPLAGIA